ncbi:MAG: ABC transporter ATP-binding protein [Clostridia bacterium]|nr:ABC transporter ATP-binding protein [Clostridia bacterium]
MKKPLLKLDNLSHVYYSVREETVALKHISLEVKEGEFFGLVGPSGSGKTTLLSIMAGVLTPTEGQIQLSEGDIHTDVGYMLQHDHLFEWRSIYDNVILGLEINRKKTPENLQYAEELLKKYGLHEFMKHHPQELSGGMRQRAALIRTLVLRPKIILLDEPFSALDYQTRLSVAEDVRAIIKNEGLTAILVTHDISEALSLCDRIAVLTARPATVKATHEVPLEGDSFERREDARFAAYFKAIWKELEIHEEKSTINRTSTISEPPNSE